MQQFPLTPSRSTPCRADRGRCVAGGSIFRLSFPCPTSRAVWGFVTMPSRGDQPQFLRALLASEKELNFKFHKIKGAENKDFIGREWEVRLKALLENLPLRFALVLEYLFWVFFPPPTSPHVLYIVLGARRRCLQGPQNGNPSPNLQLKTGDSPGF